MCTHVYKGRESCLVNDNDWLGDALSHLTSKSSWPGIWLLTEMWTAWRNSNIQTKGMRSIAWSNALDTHLGSTAALVRGYVGVCWMVSRSRDPCIPRFAWSCTIQGIGDHSSSPESGSRYTTVLPRRSRSRGISKSSWTYSLCIQRSVVFGQGSHTSSPKCHGSTGHYYYASFENFRGSHHAVILPTDR